MNGEDEMVFTPLWGLHLKCVWLCEDLLDNCIVKILPGPALPLLQMLNVCLARYIVHSILHSLLKNKYSYNLRCIEATLRYILVSFCLKLSAPLLGFGKSEHKLLLLCLDSTPILAGDCSFSAERELLENRLLEDKGSALTAGAARWLSLGVWVTAAFLQSFTWSYLCAGNAPSLRESIPGVTSVPCHRSGGDV